MPQFINIKGAKVHNLKNVDVKIPRDQFVVITGLSGSGKSSLAFDTIYAEGQRRYVESLSSYARQFLDLMDKPDVEQIDGLSPAISIDQKSSSRNPRSTVGTVTEIYDYLRLLFAKIGIPHCHKCGKALIKQSQKEITNKIWQLPKESEFIVLAPIIKNKKGEHRQVLERLKASGYKKLRMDGEFYSLKEALKVDLDKYKKHTIEVAIDHLRCDGTKKTKDRLIQVVNIALDLGNGFLSVYLPRTKEDIIFSEHFTCLEHPEVVFASIESRNFSFNSPHGACTKCTGLGTKLTVDPDLVIPNKKLALAEGAIRPWSRTAANQNWYTAIVEAVAKRYRFSARVPVAELTDKQLNIILNGTGDETYKIDIDKSKFNNNNVNTFEGVIPNLARRYRETDSDYIRSEIERYMRVEICEDCQGKRLKPEVLNIKVANKSISDIVSQNIDDLKKEFKTLSKKLSETENIIAKQIIKEISNRLVFLENVGLNYLTLDRTASTLSGGEAQRIRLATQIGSSLTGVLYILDEPSIGLHQMDNAKLITALKDLRDLGNSVIVVEHDEETMLAADHLIDIGPGAGKHGGEIVAAGTPLSIKKNPKSLTGQYMSGKKSIIPPKKYRKGNGKTLSILGAKAFNLKDVDVEFPLGKFISVTGVSGSGKSTLMTEILAKALTKHFYRSKDKPGIHKEIIGLENIDKVIDIDQSPIGRTPRSNPATYTGAFTYIRDLFADLPEAQIRGYKAGRFSFNVRGGRCENCQGDGSIKIEMNFLSNVYVECKECHGRRYNDEALEIHYKDKDISELLQMTADEAMKFFDDVPNIHNKLKTLVDVGLGYIKLGQPATTLSGGEAQRIKLATELSRRSSGKTLYILDEPTTGLHYHDVKKLLEVLQRLVDKGNTVLIIEHNLDVIKSSDWIIDLGPEGGDKGGYVVATGTPLQVAKIKESHTGRYLAKMFNKK
ncbi:MAG: excinuclease ABC subunit UvrA [Candidatus Komeilibacteria bacterium]|jgi:excinuclease ABC subunit A|nr:excinuclease ABC subunit UvrA [Candidatus Komeilibacteria bacterium]